MGTDDRRRDRLAAALRDHRESLGLSRRDVADRSGLSYPYVSQLENGDREPSMDALGKLAAAFGTPVEDLLKPPDPQVSLVTLASVMEPPPPVGWHANPAYPSTQPRGARRSRSRRVDLDGVVEDAYAALLPLAPRDRLDAAGMLLARCLRDAGSQS